MGESDIFILGQRLDTHKAKHKYNGVSVRRSDIEQELVVVNLLGIEDSFYDIEKFYNEQARSRQTRITLKYDLNINISVADKNKTVKLESHDSIVLLRHGHHTYAEVIDSMNRIGFDILHSSTSHDHEQIFVVSKVSTLQ
jgi:hypothetical protein